MDYQTRLAMQPNDAVDTVQISRLKTLFWDLENMRREYGSLFPDIPPLQSDLVALVPALVADAKAKHLPPVNVVSPRTPLPPDREGMLNNGIILRDSIAAHSDPAKRIGDSRWVNPKR